MKFGAYWFRLRVKNPDLNDESAKMTQTVESFRKCLEQAYEVGREEGQSSKKSGPLDFSNMFGG